MHCPSTRSPECASALGLASIGSCGLSCHRCQETKEASSHLRGGSAGRSLGMASPRGGLLGQCEFERILGGDALEVGAVDAA